MIERRFALLVVFVAGCNGMVSGPKQGERAAADTALPTCTLTVTNGYPSSYVCNAAAVAQQETLSCEVEAFDALGQLHGIRPGLPAAQITWWCQTEMASAIALSCTASATNPCTQIHVYPGIAIYNTAAAIQQSIKLNLVPPVETAPDGKPCPSAAGGDTGGVADMDGEDGPVVNWVMNRDNVINFNAFSDGDFNNVNQRIAYYQGACTRPATHTIFLAQRVLHAADSGKPDSGCPTSNTPFALDANGLPNLTILNQLRADVGCPQLADANAALEAERLACQGIIADEQRIMQDGQLGLFPMGFAFVQLRRQYNAFVGLNCNAQFGLVDLNAGNCDPQKCGPTTPCGTNGCVGVCGTCAASNMTCDLSGQCLPVCVPHCNGRMCGPDGCGGTCGACTAGSACDIAGRCEPLPQSTPVSFAHDVQPILDARCTGCHSGGQLDFDFTSNVAWAKLVNVKSKSCQGRTFVIPGDATHSYFVDKTVGTLGLCAGGSMRYGTTDAEVQTIVDWINQGAQNN